MEQARNTRRLGAKKRSVNRLSGRGEWRESGCVGCRWMKSEFLCSCKAGVGVEHEQEWVLSWYT